jgi:hypothetical protein
MKDPGRPTAVRAGKPVYKYVYKRLVSGKRFAACTRPFSYSCVSDLVFAATQDLAVNTKALAGAESIIKAGLASHALTVETHVMLTEL